MMMLAILIGECPFPFLLSPSPLRPNLTCSSRNRTEADSRKRARSASQEDDKKPKTPAAYDQRTWERENVQAQYNSSRGRGRGRGFARHDTYWK
jgi:hypothetical protein